MIQNLELQQEHHHVTFSFAFWPSFSFTNKNRQDVSSVRIELIRKGETQVLKAKTPLLSGLKVVGLRAKGRI